MNTQFKKGVLEMCILQVVKEKDMYGFEVIEKLGTVLDVNQNTIYPLLRRLTKQGNFSIYEKDSPYGAKRKYYKITDSGIKRLNKFLDEWSKFLNSVNLILEEGENNER